MSWLLLFTGLHLAVLYSYNLFHGLAEIFAVVVACGIFMVAWNTRSFNRTPYLTFLGVAYLFVAVLDLLHTLAYQGMGVFHYPGANLATQLWIAARYLEAFSLLAASLLALRRARAELLLALYAVVTALVLWAVFSGLFPVCYSPAVGLTPFKIYSEYLICLTLVAAAMIFWRRAAMLDRTVLRLILASIACTIASELSFTLYIHAYGLANQIGHYLKIISFYLIYRASVSASLKRPYEVLFRDLGVREQRLRASEGRLRAILGNAAALVIFLAPDWKMHEFNLGAQEIFGWQRREVLARDFLSVLIPPEQTGTVEALLRQSLAGNPQRQIDTVMLDKDGKAHHILWNCTRLDGSQEQALGLVISGLDITVRIEYAKEREKLIKSLQEALAQVKTLSGLLPICSHCKKIRDDSGYWRQIEQYVENHSQAEFSHSMCPQCAHKLYPEYFPGPAAEASPRLKKSGNPPKNR
ncbi:MAG: PAS domain S-box protein [Desulfarculaceae bacterium]|nr:PAS domain S-box protein [Desulfarculaceae bacterium]MCF8049061.1 PAS domain S-box protein [Desulfarculaceae bacterium]MCF8098757.1 PAS domain S-box protein [Desulfarculaceae bacterium]MCF8123780.1 PAS domain S-box protein [Desulfarculaceae bacterium]